MGGACGTQAGFGGPPLTKRDQLELTGLLGRLIFKGMVRKENGMQWRHEAGTCDGDMRRAPVMGT